MLGKKSIARSPCLVVVVCWRRRLSRRRRRHFVARKTKNSFVKNVKNEVRTVSYTVKASHVSRQWKHVVHQIHSSEQ